MLEVLEHLPHETIAFLAYIQVGILVSAWLFRRRLAELRRRLAIEQANRGAMLVRFEEALAAIESRMSRLESTPQAQPAKARRRREAARRIRNGADPVVVAKYFRLPQPEAELLREVQIARRSLAATPG